ncbi:hypothetical protein QBC38DRAFT_486288 [Podospora fimiseda]|uniref:DUF1993 domain-containing protein n=1 Tax=Podospora fimiseda TaxID=252190 RepID=A0AAN7GWP5_9PEZI|nr:hypothetical protein QBC38DRAFT_486288 [Podospora fimiseda]
MSSTPSIPLEAVAGIATSQSHKILLSLHNILTKALPHPDSSTFTTSRIHPEMHPLSFQVQILHKFAKALITPTQPGANKWAGVHEVPPTQDLPELIELIEGIKKEVENVSQKEIITTVEGPHFVKSGEDRPSFTFTSEGFVLDFVLPNMYFHLNTAYAILRNKGVDVGKWDYLAPFSGPYLDKAFTPDTTGANYEYK